LNRIDSKEKECHSVQEKKKRSVKEKRTGEKCERPHKEENKSCEERQMSPK
jgi:hypothetical protein